MRAEVCKFAFLTFMISLMPFVSGCASTSLRINQMTGFDRLVYFIFLFVFTAAFDALFAYSYLPAENRVRQLASGFNASFNKALAVFIPFLLINISDPVAPLAIFVAISVYYFYTLLTKKCGFSPAAAWAHAAVMSVVELAAIIFLTAEYLMMFFSGTGGVPFVR